jgi:hypothetical protein
VDTGDSLIISVEKVKHINSILFSVFLLLLSFGMLISMHVMEVKGVPYWLREGSYAEYLLGRALRFNNGTFTWATFVYGWRCIRKTHDYASLEVYLKRHDGEIVKSIQVQVDLVSKNLIDAERGEAWGKCLFWIDPWDMGEQNVVMMFNWTGRTIYTNISRPFGEGELPPEVLGRPLKTPFKDFKVGEMCSVGFAEGEHLDGGIFTGTLINVWYDVKSGLAVVGHYLDDILHNRFDVLEVVGGPSGWLYPAVLLDTNIFEIKENSDSLPIILGVMLATSITVAFLGLTWWRRKKKHG